MLPSAFADRVGVLEKRVYHVCSCEFWRYYNVDILGYLVVWPGLPLLEFLNVWEGKDLRIKMVCVETVDKAISLRVYALYAELMTIWEIVEILIFATFDYKKFTSASPELITFNESMNDSFIHRNIW